MSNVSLTENTTASVTNTSNLVDPSIHMQKLALAALLSIVIVVVIIGNTLVILAVITTRRLRTVTNCFVMSLAVADWLVGVFVMPPAVAYALMGKLLLRHQSGHERCTHLISFSFPIDKWKLGRILCHIWVSLDILLCTASILSLCAISVDRYLAVTRPLSYSRRRRSKRLAFSMILVVWLSSALITCPPIFGWWVKKWQILYQFYRFLSICLCLPINVGQDSIKFESIPHVCYVTKALH